MTLALPGTAALGDILIRTDGVLVDGNVISQTDREIIFHPDGADALSPPQRLDRATISRVLLTDNHGELLSNIPAATQPAESWPVPPEPQAPPIDPPTSAPTYYLIPLHGEVGVTVLASTLERSLEDALARHPTVVLLDIDSPGGLVAESTKIIELLHRYNKKLRIVAFTNQDLSAAAIFTLSVREIYVKSTSTIGAATSFIPGTRNLPARIDEKMQSAWRAMGRNSAEEGRHEPLLADAMISNDTELHLEFAEGKLVVREGSGIHILCRKGEILTLSSHEAVDCGLAAGEADDLTELGAALKLANWTECKGLGTLLATALPERAKAFSSEMQKSNERLHRDMQDATAAAPERWAMLETTVTGTITEPQNELRSSHSLVPMRSHALPRPRMPLSPIAPFRPEIRTPRYAHVEQFPPPGLPSIQQARITVSSFETHPRWKADSLACVVALLRCEKDLIDAMALCDAYGHLNEMPGLQEALGQTSASRATVYDNRNLYGGAAPSAPAVVRTPPVSFIADPKPHLEEPKLPANRVRTEVFGGSDGNPLILIDPAGKPLIGMRCVVGSPGRIDRIHSITPIFQRSGGEPPAGSIDIIARDGYVVCGMMVNDDNRHIFAVQLHFMRWKEDHFDFRDSYESDFVGEPNASMTRTLGDDGQIVYGLFIRQDATLTAVGLIANRSEK